MRSTDFRMMTRRSAIAGAAITMSGALAGGKMRAATGQMAQMPAKPSNRNRTSLHQEWQIPAAPARVYAVLLDEKQFARMTALPAEIDAKAGGAFSLFQGQIVGRNVELVPDVRVVQAWRPTHWDAGVYSIVRFELKAQGTGTMVMLDHTGFPEGEYDSLNFGWTNHYAQPLAKFFS